jgi:Uma2 family endonuclease
MAMPALHPTDRRHWTAREVRELIAASPLATPRYELVDGELLVTPSPHFNHQNALLSLILKLGPYLERQPVGHVVFSPSDVELEPEFISQPDAFVVPLHEFRRLRRGAMPVRELMLAIEVLSPSSSRHDRVRKRPLYQRHVPEYWIIDLDARLFERWRPADERPEMLTHSLEWHPAGAAEPFHLDLNAYFAELFDER